MIFLIIFFSIIIGVATPIVVVKGVKNHRRNIVFKTSDKVKKLEELQKDFVFTNPKNVWNYTFHCNSLKQYRKISDDSLKQAFFEIYYNQVIDSLKKIKENKDNLEKYNESFDKIVCNETVISDEVGLKPETYKKYENAIIDTYKKNVEDGIKINIMCEYTSPAGRNHYEDGPITIRVNNVSTSDINFFELSYSPYYKPCGMTKQTSVPPSEPKTGYNGDYISQYVSEKQAHEIKEQKTFRYDFYVTLRVEVSVLHKIIFDFEYLNRFNETQCKEYVFNLNVDGEFKKKIDGIRYLINEIYYCEDYEKRFNLLNELKEAANKIENFHLEMKEITLEMLKELDYKLNVAFACDLDGNVFIESAQIGMAQDIDAYFAENPNSLFLDTMNWVSKTLDSVNNDYYYAKNHALKNEILSQSNENCHFFFSEHLTVEVSIGFVNQVLRLNVEPAFYYNKQSVTMNSAKSLTLNEQIFQVCKAFEKDVKKINDLFLRDFSKIIKKLIPLRERYKDNNTIKFIYDDSIIHSGEWMKYFSLRPDVEPIHLEELNEGDLVCNPRILSKMRDYQKYAFDWMNKLVSNSFSGILADDMGLGKTLEMISVINADKTELPNLIVCPLSLLHNWKNEFQKWCPEEKVVVFRYFYESVFNNSDFNSKINYIISYDLLIRNIDKLKEIRFNYLILDEAQYIKNSYTSRSNSAKKIVANYRFALTGTPLENKEDDLINIFDFIMPSLKRQYNLDHLSREVQKEYISPFLLRRRKSDVLTELPEKNTIVVNLDMSKEQKSFYDTYKSTHADINDQYVEILALLTKLRQICISPQLIDSKSDIASVKIDYMFELINTIIDANESVLIYSFFASVFDYIEPLMKKRNIKYVRLDGSVSQSKRVEIIDEFDKNDDIHCFLVSLKAGGVGLNLTKANNVIFLDPWWNIAVENQASDRTHRIGQEKNVTIYRLICKDTIEEKVLEIQNEKINLINFFVESNGDDPLGKLTLDMMRDLLK